ncbi:glycoside hydrolase family 25 protein [Vibrio nomapromontoriensis]|uniref:glycoside hydrolase family 25 protein n=1 Tax=Vibrio nomapromontoriensis TaxID=2910246 RepID=UPI003D0C9D64
MRINYKLVLSVFLLIISGVIFKVIHHGVNIHSGIIKGIDVSHYQGKIIWKSVDTDDIKFSIAKASGGVSYIDPDFNVNWNGMKEQSLIRGAYHFFYPQDDPVKQANNYLKVVGTFQPKDLPPIVDVEVTGEKDTDAIVTGLLQWLTTVEKATKRRPMIYSDLDFAQQYLSDPRLRDYPLWIAEYSDVVKTLPKPWQSQGWTIWQYSQTGEVAGIDGDVDLDQFKGSKKELKAFIKSTHLTH